MILRDQLLLNPANLIIKEPRSSRSLPSLLNIFNKLIMNFVKYVFNSRWWGVGGLSDSQGADVLCLGAPAVDADMSDNTSRSSKTT